MVEHERVWKNEGLRVWLIQTDRSIGFLKWIIISLHFTHNNKKFDTIECLSYTEKNAIFGRCINCEGEGGALIHMYSYSAILSFKCTAFKGLCKMRTSLRVTSVRSVWKELTLIKLHSCMYMSGHVKNRMSMTMMKGVSPLYHQILKHLVANRMPGVSFSSLIF